MQTNELLLAANQRAIEEERRSYERERNEKNLADWYDKGGPALWYAKAAADGDYHLIARAALGVLSEPKSRPEVGHVG